MSALLKQYIICNMKHILMQVLSLQLHDSNYEFKVALGLYFYVPLEYN